MGQTLQKVLTATSTVQAEFGDAFISTEHLALGLAREDNRFTKRALGDQGIDEVKILDAVKKIRGPQKVTTRNPEASYEVRSWNSLSCENWRDNIAGVDSASMYGLLILAKYIPHSKHLDNMRVCK